MLHTEAADAEPAGLSGSNREDTGVGFQYGVPDARRVSDLRRKNCDGGSFPIFVGLRIAVGVMSQSTAGLEGGGISELEGDLLHSSVKSRMYLSHRRTISRSVLTVV